MYMETENMKIEKIHIAKKWLTLRDCADYLGITNRAVYCLVHRGKLPAHRNGRRLYFLIDEIDQTISGKAI